MDIEINKKEEKRALRQEMKQKVGRLPPAYCQEADKKICALVRALPEYRAARTIFAYVGMSWEIHTQPLLEQILADGKILGVPLCISKGIMEVRRLTSMADLEPGQYGLLEPGTNTALIRGESIDLGIIPCCTCNEDGWRLGYGGGFYDTYLRNSHFTRVVLCRHKLMTRHIPVEAHDERMDIVITEKEVIRRERQNDSPNRHEQGPVV